MRYDVYMIYRHSNGADIARLVSLALKSRGYRVCFNYGEGTDLSDEEKYKAIDSSEIVMLVMTEGVFDDESNGAYINSVSAELYHAMSNGKHIVPVGPTNQKWCFPINLPSDIAAVANLQVSRLDMESLFEASIDKIELERFSNELKERARRCHDIIMSSGPVTPNFVGRMSELEKLRDVLFAGKIAIVTGACGVGVTEFVKKYACSCQRDYSGGILIVNCNAVNDWNGVFGAIASLRLNTGDSVLELLGMENFDVDAFRIALANRASKRGPILIVVEDVQNPEALLGNGIWDAFPDGIAGRGRIEIIMTTHGNEMPAHPALVSMVLKGLDTDEAVELLLKDRPSESVEERNAAVEVAQLLKGHPVLLKKVPEIIGDMYSSVICESYVDLAEQLKANFDSIVAERVEVAYVNTLKEFCND